VDLTNAAAVASSGAAFDAVIQSVSSRGGGADDYRRIYLQGARNLASAFPEAMLLFTSSTSVYAQANGEWVNEESAAEPIRETARVLRETEEFVLAGKGIVARLAGLYGPGRSALLRKFLEGRAVLDPSADRFVNHAHRDDVASALFFLVRRWIENRTRSAAVDAQIYNVSDNHPISQRDCYAWLASHLHRPLPPSVGAAAERKRGNSNKRVSSAKLQAIGWAPRFPTFESAMRESILPAEGFSL
jgi:nucleoside-diphosphate-sugar epimerase